MNLELHSVLEGVYHSSLEAQPRRRAESEQAYRSGDMVVYFDRALHIQLPDIYWALERWEEARHWYRHNARIFQERRAWLAQHPNLDEPLDGLVDWEATTAIKAGDLEPGRLLLERAIAHWQRRPERELVLSELGLHAAQAGLPHLAQYATAAVTARQELPGGRSEAARRARALLHYEPAQVAFLLGQWEELTARLDELAEAEWLVAKTPGLAFPAPLEAALVAAARGLRILAGIRTGEVAQEVGPKAALAAFEDAMLAFYHFGGRTDWNTYFMRLNTRLAEELAAGRPLQPNPFAEGGQGSR